MRLLLTIKFLFFLPLMGWGNELFIFKNPITGQDIYELVNQSEKGADEKLPGVYEIDSKTGESRLIVAGEVLGLNRGFNGILSYSSVSSDTQSTSDVLIVLNGQLTILNRNSSERERSSLLTLGLGGNVDVVDVLQSLPVAMPPIHSIDQIQLVALKQEVLTGEMGMAQVFLLSIESPNTFGSGFTTVFALKKPTGPKDTPELLNNKVYVIGYDFLRENQLKQLVAFKGSSSEEFQIFAPSVINMVAARMNFRKEHPLIKKWISHLSNFLKSLIHTTVQVDKPPEEKIGIPTFSLISETIKLDLQIADVIMSKPFALLQSFNPITGEWQVFLENKTDYIHNYHDHDQNTPNQIIGIDSKRSSAAILGEVDLENNSRDYKVYLSEASYKSDGKPSQPSYLIAARGSILALLSTETSDKYLRGVIHNEFINLKAIKKLNFVHAMAKIGEGNKNYHYLICSFESNTRKKTTRVLVFEEKGGELTFSRVHDLMPTYITEAEVKARLTYGLNNQNGEQALLFDNISTVKGISVYSKLPVTARTVPLFNLLSLADQKQEKQIYAKEEEKITIIPDKVYFRRFNRTGAMNDRTGIYLQTGEPGNKRQYQLVTNGELFFRRKGRGNKNVLEEDDLQFDKISEYSAFPSMGAAIFPINPNVGKPLNKRSFSLALSVWANTLGYSTSINVSNVDIPFESVQAVKIVHGRRLKQEFLTVLLFVSSPQTQGIFAMNYKISLDITQLQKKIVVTPSSESGWITKEQVSPQSLKLRLKADRAGEYYWINALEADPESAKFSVRSLLTPNKIIYPHKEGSRVTLRMSEIYEEGVWGVATTGGLWLALSRRDIMAKNKWFEEEWKKYDKRLEASVKKGQKYNYSILPLFKNFLESFADRSHRLQNLKRQVVIIEDRMMKEMMSQLYMHLLVGDGKFSLDSRAGRDFDLHVYDDTATAGEIIRELEHIAATSQTRNSVLIVEASKVLESGELVDDSESLEEEAGPSKISEEEQESKEEGTSKLSRMLLLATDGKARILSEAKRYKGVPADLPLLMFATPNEWDGLKIKYAKEYETGLFDNFEVNRQFQTSSWTLWPSYSDKASTLVKDMARLPITREERRVFPTLEELLNEAVTGQSAGKQRIVLVPEELKRLILKLIIGRWATSNVEKDDEAWSHTNEKLSLFMINGTRDDNLQEGIKDNFNAMRGAAVNRAVALFGTLEDVIRVGRPYSSGSVFKIKDPATSLREDLYSDLMKDASIAPDMGEVNIDMLKAKLDRLYDEFSEMNDGDNLGEHEDAFSVDRSRLHTIGQQIEFIENLISQSEDGTDSGDIVGQNINESSTAAIPHLMWWIATEGHSIQPKKSKTWKIQQVVKGVVSTLLIGTREEFNVLAQEMSFESKFFDLDTHFEILELSPPNVDVKYNLVNSLFNRSEISSLGYQFHLDDKNGEEAKSQLIYFLINRTEQIANQEEYEQTSAFVRTFTELKRSLVEDVELRKNRVIDKPYLDRLFTRIFPLPLNPASLRPDHPINKLLRTKNAVREMTEIGYKGSPDLKKRIFDNIMSQTRGAVDAGRPIPSSMIFYGDTSTGKTFFFESLVRMLGLEMYDRRRPNNENAAAIIVNCGSLTEEDNGDPTKFTVKQAIDDIKDLMAQPNGHQAYILFDDAHKCGSDKIRIELFTFIQSFFEAEEGLMRVKRKGTNEIREVPVQNLNLFMTVNPASNKKRVREYTDGEDDITKHVLAAISKGTWELEESFLARWTEIINFDKFPRSAKVPELVSRIRQSSRGAPHMVLVEPEAVDRLVDQFPDAHARNFLSPAAAAISQVPHGALKAPLYIVSPKTFFGKVNERDSGRTRKIPVDASSLSQKVKEITQIDAVTRENVDSQLRLISFILQGFRTQIYNNLVLEVSNSDSLDLPISGLQGVIKRNFILALVTHITEGRYLPMSEVRIDGFEMSYLSKTQREELYELQKSYNAKFFPIDFSMGQSSDYVDANSFVTDGASLSREKSRRDVLSDYAHRLELVLRKMIRLYMRMDNYKTVENVRSWSDSQIREWFNNLNGEDLEPRIKEINQEIIELYKAFQQDITNPDLLEEKDTQKTSRLNYYDQSRLFAYVLDKTISRLPWGLLAKFTMDIVNNAEDMSMGQKPVFIDYAYSNQFSPFAIVTPDFLSEVLDKNLAEQQAQSFSLKCDALLSSGVADD